MTDAPRLTLAQLHEIIDACTGLAPPDVLLGTNRASIGDVARQCIAVMQENDALRTESETFKQWRDLALAIGVREEQRLQERANDHQATP